MRIGKFLTIFIIIFMGIDAICVFAGPREDLTQLLQKVYPEEWSGRIEWFYTAQRNVVSDLHDADVNQHDVEYFDSNQLKYVTGTVGFNGSESVSSVYDGEMYVAFYGGSQNPSIDYPEFYPGNGASAFIVYLYLSDPQAYKVVKTEDQLIVKNLKGADVYFNMDTGYVSKVISGQFTMSFDKYADVQGCPWAMRVKSGFGDPDKFDMLYLKVEYKKLNSEFFDYARFYPKSSHDDKGNRIVYLGPQRLLADDARQRKWPDSLDGWNTLLDQVANDYSNTVTAVQMPAVNRSSPSTTGSFNISYRTLIWIGVFLVGTGLTGMIFYRIRK